MAATTVFDRISSDATIMSRGYLELVLDEQNCEGSSPKNSDGSANLTLTLYLIDQVSTRLEFNVFATRVPAIIDKDTRKKLLTRFMDTLTTKYRVSAFSLPDTIDREELERFGSEVEYATPSWIQ